MVVAGFIMHSVEPCIISSGRRGCQEDGQSVGHPDKQTRQDPKKPFVNATRAFFFVPLSPPAAGLFSFCALLL